MAALNSSELVSVVGAGTMGAGIAQVAAQAGHTVYLYDVAAELSQQGWQNIADGLERLRARGKLEESEREQILQRIKPTHNIHDLSPSCLVIEAIVEDLSIKRDVFLQLQAICSEQVLFASNTSSLSLTALASVLQRPGSLCGMHFFNPAPIMKLVEVVSGLDTEPEVAEIIFDTAMQWGKRPIHVKSSPGFIVNRVARPYYLESLRVLEEKGADIETIDSIMRECGGFRMGPFELMDLIGLDVNYAVTASVFSAYHNDPYFTPSLLLKELVDAGFLGRKTARGFYDYADKSSAPSPTEKGFDSVNTQLDIKYQGDFGVAAPLLALCKPVHKLEKSDGDSAKFIIDDVHIALTDGRSATERGMDEGTDEFVVFDLALDYKEAKIIAIAASDRSSGKAVQVATALLQSLGKSIVTIADTPGMIVMRTVCMLSNVASDVVHQHIGDIESVDNAMLFGVNYPLGPFAWADRIGLAYIICVLNNMADNYMATRYRVSPLLKRKALTGSQFYA